MRFKILMTAALLIYTAISPGAENDKMRAKVIVQERIIDTILKSDTAFSITSETEGIYISGFGAIFTIQAGDYHDDFSGGFLWETPGIYFKIENIERSIIKTQDELEEYNEAAASYDKSSKEYNESLKRYQEERAKELEIELKRREELERELKRRMGALFSRLKEYMTDYGGALTLPADERLMIRGSCESYNPIDDRRRDFEIWTTGGELNKLLSGKLKRDKFIEGIEVRELDGSEGPPTDIEIMNTILATVFEDGERDGFLWSSFGKRDSWGTYIPGFGALFFQRQKLGWNLLSIISHNLFGSQNNFLIALDDEQAKGDGKGVNVDELQESISDLLVTYIPTLKSVKPQEQVVVAVKFDRSFDEENHQMLILKVKKKLFQQHRDKGIIRKKIEVVKL